MGDVDDKRSGGLLKKIIQGLPPRYAAETNAVKDVARQLGIFHMTSRGEADHGLVQLARDGVIDAIYTHDTDLMVHAVSHDVETPILLEQAGNFDVKVW